MYTQVRICCPLCSKAGHGKALHWYHFPAYVQYRLTAQQYYKCTGSKTDVTSGNSYATWNLRVKPVLMNRKIYLV
jgi:hypothetical protein